MRVSCETMCPATLMFGWPWGFACCCLWALFFIPLFAQILHLTTPTKEAWALILLMSLFPLVTGRILKRLIGI